ncbi:M13 family metallopeptidase [Sphingomonas alba]|uniref:M13 family metallopeptidase n=1 Tax=Sphingomonas alba TaxID=2908208 RepID=A0ABT0RNR3_9SPHN|nr:M13 family metallopeptidase [Sphingomonas alba]MCL6684281.1 M13 family metallopeptidase [Sphingomonas alba]
MIHRPHRVRLGAVLLACSAFVTVPAAAQTPAPAEPKVVHFGTWGVDLSTRDTSVKPGDDFQRYAAGHWLDTNEIPADKSQNGIGSELADRNQEQLRAIVMTAPADSQLGAFYKSYMDEARLEQLDDAPLKPELAKIDAIKTKDEFTRYMAGTFTNYGSTLFASGPLPDPNNPKVNVSGVYSNGMGMPDRDYYLLDKYKPQRDAYRAYMQRIFEMTGVADASATADMVLAFETEIAKVSWPQTDLRDIQKLNNPMTLTELQAYAPQINWGQYLGSVGALSPRFIVGDNTALKAVAALYDKTPLETLKAWERFKVANDASPYLSKRFVDSRFTYVKTLTGAKELRPRWRRGIGEVDGRLGELLGKTYVDQYFPAQSKTMMEELVANLKKAAAKRIQGNSWMGAATKQAALTKLAKMDVMVGYPDKFRDYSKLVMKPDDLFGNIQRSAAFEWAYALEDLNKPVDRKKWAMSPATVDAYNGGLENKIVFPAGILQPPFFDPTADAAVNYGAAGAIIGHEIMHGFDDQGRKIDETGAVRDWWTADDAKRFTALTDALGKQYSSYEAAPGVFINGTLTMGENIGDMSGLEVAYEAYKMSLNGKPAPVIDGLTGPQRFFLSFAQAWRGKQREEAIKSQVATDPHSPRRYRIIGPLRNLDAWYEAFKVGPDSKFYIPPEKRVRLW